MCNLSHISLAIFLAGVIAPPLAGGICGRLLFNQLRHKIDPKFYDRYDLNRLADVRSNSILETGFFAPHVKSQDLELINVYRGKLRVTPGFVMIA